MKGLIEVSSKKAYRVNGILVEGRPMVSLRQMYRNRDSKEWQVGYRTIAVDLDKVGEVAAEMIKVSKAGIDTFETIDVDRPKEKPVRKRKGVASESESMGRQG